MTCANDLSMHHSFISFHSLLLLCLSDYLLNVTGLRDKYVTARHIPIPPHSRSQQDKTIIFDVSKHKTHTPQPNFKKLYRRLRSQYKVKINKSNSNSNNNEPFFSSKKLLECDYVVFGAPRRSFTTEEERSLKKFVEEDGKSLFFLVTKGSSSGGGSKSSGGVTTMMVVNRFLEEYGRYFN